VIIQSSNIILIGFIYVVSKVINIQIVGKFWCSIYPKKILPSQTLGHIGLHKEKLDHYKKSYNLPTKFNINKI